MLTHSKACLEDKSAENTDSRGRKLEVFENQDSIINQSHLYDNLAKNLVSFCPCPETVSKTECKNSELNLIGNIRTGKHSGGMTPCYFEKATVIVKEVVSLEEKPFLLHWNSRVLRFHRVCI